MNCPLCHRHPSRFWSCSLELGSEFHCAYCAAPLRRRNGRLFRIANLVLGALMGAFHQFLPIPGELASLAAVLIASIALELLRRRFEHYEAIPPAQQSSV